MPYTFDLGIFDQGTNAKWYVITGPIHQGHFPSLCLLNGRFLISPVLKPYSYLDGICGGEDECLERSGEKGEVGTRRTRQPAKIYGMVSWQICGV